MVFQRLYGVVAAVAVALVPATAGAQSPPGVGAIFSEHAIESPQLSPDGTRLLFIRRPQPGDEDKDQASLVIVDYTDLNAPAARQLPADAEGLRWAGWANNDGILISWNILADIDGYGALIIDGDGDLRLIRRIWRTLLLAMDADGSNVTQLMDQNGRANIYQTQMTRTIFFCPCAVGAAR